MRTQCDGAILLQEESNLPRATVTDDRQQRSCQWRSKVKREGASFLPGQVESPRGPDGPDGPDGSDGLDGLDGPDGLDGRI